METMLEALERKRSLMHVSEKPWSEYSKSDYTPEQWHRACLIHLHDGAPTSKDQCKLPVRTPNGAVSRPGVHAAAAALAGARGGVDASDEQKASAARALVRYYNSFNETPPESLVEHSELVYVDVKTDDVTDSETDQTDESQEDDKGFDINAFLEHYGVKGMKWGVRSRAGEVKARVRQDVAERRSSETTVRAKPGQMVRVVGGNRRGPNADAINARISEQVAKRSTLDALSNKDLQHLVNRMNLEAQYRNLAVKETRKSAAEKWAEQLVSEKGEVLYSKLGPYAAIGRKVVEGAMKGRNKAMGGGIVSDKDKKKNK